MAGDWMEELLAFPSARDDDRVDSTSQARSLLACRRRCALPPDRGQTMRARLARPLVHLAGRLTERKRGILSTIRKPEGGEFGLERQIK